MNDQVINRIEKKYLLTKKQKQALLKLIRRNMKKDSYHKSKVLNLYFDNDNFESISESIDWVTFKKKVRARSYEGYDRVFLEIKTKIHASEKSERIDPDEACEENIGHKRRVMITHSDFRDLIEKKRSLTALAERSIESTNDLQIAHEIDYLIAKFHLEPKILVSYSRESYKDEQGLRITFDEKLKYRDQNLSFNTEKHDKIYFKNDRNIIMEIKAQGVVPLWLAHGLSEQKAYPEQFSKIGKVYQILKKGQNV